MHPFSSREVLLLASTLFQLKQKDKSTIKKNRYLFIESKINFFLPNEIKRLVVFLVVYRRCFRELAYKPHVNGVTGGLLIFKWTSWPCRMRQQTKKKRMRRSETREECKGKQALAKLERKHRNRV